MTVWQIRLSDTASTLMASCSATFISQPIWKKNCRGSQVNGGSLIRFSGSGICKLEATLGIENMEFEQRRSCTLQ